MKKRSLLVTSMLVLFVFIAMSFTSINQSYYFNLIGSDGHNYQIEMISSTNIIVHDGSINYTGSGFIEITDCGGPYLDTDYVRVTITKNGNTVTFFSNDCIFMYP